MSIIVSQPFNSFHNSDGDSLNNGYIYIGEENLNPETNPISIYWDSDLTIPASQPVRTINGYPSRSGSASQIYSNESYSITVRDSNKELVYSSLSSDDITIPTVPWFKASDYGDKTLTSATIMSALTEIETQIGSNVNYTLLISRGDWAITDNLTIPVNVTLFFEEGSKFIISSILTGEGCKISAGYNEIFNITSGSLVGSWIVPEIYGEWFGAVGDGVTSDQIAFDNAMTFLGTLGGGTLKLLNKTYVVDLVINTDYVNVHGVSRGNTIIKSTNIGIHVNNDAIMFDIRDIRIFEGAIGVKLGTIGTGELVTRGKLENVYIFQNTSYGIYMDNCLEVKFVNCWTYFCGDHGVYNAGNSINTLISFENCQFQQSDARGVFLQSGVDIRFHGCSFESNNSDGILLFGAAGTDGCQSIYLDTCWFEDNCTDSGQAQIVLDGTAATEGVKNVYVTNCLIGELASLPSIQAVRVKGATFERCDIRGTFADQVKYSSGTSQTFDFLIKDRVNANASDINDIQAFASNGAGITLEYKIGRVSYSNARKIWRAGLTSERPSTPIAFEEFFDRTLDIPIWFNGSNWKNAAGGTV